MLGWGHSSRELIFLVIIVVKKLHVLLHLIREKVESDLIFLGLLILENRLKEETKPVLEELISARIRTVMITGIQQSGNGAAERHMGVASLSKDSTSAKMSL